MSLSGNESPASVAVLRRAVGWESPGRSDVIEQGRVDAFREATRAADPVDPTIAPPTFCVTFVTEPPAIPGAEDYGDHWLNGGDSFDILVDLRVGDTVISRARLESVEEKRGASGEFVIFSVVTDVHLADGTLAVRHTARRIRACR